jgi:DUF2892 family protein
MRMWNEFRSFGVAAAKEIVSAKGMVRKSMNPDIARRRKAKIAQQHDGGGAAQRDSSQINVGATERQLSMIGGTVLAIYGLMSRSVTGLGLAAVGGALIWRGHTGHCYCYEMLGHNSAQGSGANANRAGSADGRQKEPPLRSFMENHGVGGSPNAHEA